MFFANISKKWNVKLTIVDPWAGPEEKLIGQLWEFMLPDSKEPDHYSFNPKYLPEFEGVHIWGDGRNTRAETLEFIKNQYRKIQRAGIVSEKAKLLFSLLPVEQVF